VLSVVEDLVNVDVDFDVASVGVVDLVAGVVDEVDDVDVDVEVTGGIVAVVGIVVDVDVDVAGAQVVRGGARGRTGPEAAAVGLADGAGLESHAVKKHHHGCEAFPPAAVLLVNSITYVFEGFGKSTSTRFSEAGQMCTSTLIGRST